MRSYAIGDIHGHLELLHRAHALIDADKRAVRDPDAPVVHLGDLVDRGPDCAGVVRYLRQGVDGGAPWVVLLGNHDRLMHRFVMAPDWHDPALRAGMNWLHDLIGGRATLASYGVTRIESLTQAQAAARDHIDVEDLNFIAARPCHFSCGQVVFVHAGIRPGIPLEDQTEQDLVWIRDPFLHDTRDHGPLVVHGHTALTRPMHYRNRLNIDSGAAYGGPLTAIVIEGRDTFALTDQGRVPLVPL
jgi:serine/threonine protein phosphatase 1